MLKVTVKRRKRTVILSDRLIRKIARRTLERRNIQNGLLTILIVGDAEIKRFNRRYLNRHRATDVLAFSMREGRKLAGSNMVLGDVMISQDRAKAQAVAFGNSTKKELALYVAHGILHLTGFKDGSKKMVTLQNQIVSEFFK